MLRMEAATLSDIDSVYKLANEPAIRAVSIHKEPIPYESHVQWFKNTLDNPDIRLFLFKSELILAGQIRFDRKDSDTAEISISLSSEFRGKGLGSLMMGMAIDEIKGIWDIKNMNAIIRSDNIQSRKFFEKAGFLFHSDHFINNDPYVLYSLVLQED